jgi:FkbM family methyltransferase
MAQGERHPTVNHLGGSVMQRCHTFAKVHTCATQIQMASPANMDNSMRSKLNAIIAANYFNPPNSARQHVYRLLFAVGLKQRLIDRTLTFLSIEEYRNLDAMYQLLADGHSKDLLLRLLAYKALGAQKGRTLLPTNEPSLQLKLKDIYERMVVHGQVRFRSKGLQLYDLRPMGHDITVESEINGIYCGVLFGQYAYNSGNLVIGVRAGDVVLDLGGCYGDVSLLFAEKAGADGKVHVFEFVPSNLEVLNHNLQLNPHLKDRVSIVNRPVWSASGMELFYTDKGSGTRVGFDKTYDGQSSVSTVSVDDYSESMQLTKIDFIKMDIEGAEQSALDGAEETIRRFRPTLAICIYHSMSDFTTIIHKIHGYGLSYRFYLGHYSDSNWETVLYAVFDTDDHT